MRETESERTDVLMRRKGRALRRGLEMLGLSEDGKVPVGRSPELSCLYFGRGKEELIVYDQNGKEKDREYF